MAATYTSLIGITVGGKYELRRVLAAGGMGVVCEALHRELGKRVAVKLIEKSIKESEIIAARFRREARAAGQIQSEHIVDVFDVGADPRVGLYMVMELLSGEDLQTRLDREKRIDVVTSVTIAHHVARGLAKAHEAGVIHRDLKPANVFLTQRESGELLVKLLDFGVSKLLGEEPAAGRITGQGTPIGTPLYMSPEQAEGKEDVDGRADVWSLGAVLYEALSGTPPFPDRGSYSSTLVGILTTRPRPLHEVAPWVPPAVGSVVDAMLVHDRNARLPSAKAVTERLLDAFPGVRADGTGNHTAVIVSHASGTVDETGDTEFFTAEALGRTKPLGAPLRRESNPLVQRGSSPDVRDASSGRLQGSGAPAGGAAHGPSRFGGMTAPLPRLSNIANAAAKRPAALQGGAYYASVPPRVPSEPPPPTIRDDRLALLAERRRKMKVASIVVVVAAVGAAAFWAGQRMTPGSADESAAPPAPAKSAPAD